MDLSTRKVNSKSLTFADFVSAMQSVCSLEETNTVSRLMQKGLFSLLWERCRVISSGGKAKEEGEVVQTTKYQSLGHIVDRTLLVNTSKTELKKRYANRPLTGMIKSRRDFHNDIRFIMTTVKDEIMVFLDNSAIDNGMQTVYIYIWEDEMFIPAGSDGSLLQFAIRNTVTI